MDALLTELRENGPQRDASARLRREQARLCSERDKAEQLRLALYPDWKSGDLTREEYHALKAQYTGRLTALDRQLEGLAAQIQDAERGAAQANSLLAQFTRYRELETLTREAVTALIEQIEVEEGGGIRIHFRFSDAFSAASDYIAARQAALP